MKGTSPATTWPGVIGAGLANTRYRIFNVDIIPAQSGRAVQVLPADRTHFTAEVDGAFNDATYNVAIVARVNFAGEERVLAENTLWRFRSNSFRI